MKTRILFRLILISLFATSESPLRAQERPALEVILVTAQKREESLQDVPISVTPLDGQQLEDFSIRKLQDVTAYVPNFSMNETSTSNAISVRGISSGVNPGFEQSVGLYVDGVYHGRGQLARAPLFDMERIEVAHGPQPILFGKNSIAGAVNMTTTRPSDRFEGSISALLEPDHGEEEFRFIVSGPLTDSFAARLGILDRSFDGYMTNVYLNRTEEQRSERIVRASFEWAPTDTLAFNLKLEQSTFDTVGRNTELVNSVSLPSGGIDYVSALSGTIAAYNAAVAAQLAPPPPIPYLASDAVRNYSKATGPDAVTNELDSGSLEIEYLLGENSLTFLTGYVSYDSSHACDCDSVSAPIIDGTSSLEKFDQISQEIRLTSPRGESLDYIAGLYFQADDLAYFDTINLPPDGVLRALNPAFANIDTRRIFLQESDLLSVFAQFDWHLTDRMTLTVGGRYTNESKTAERSQIHHAGGVPFPATDPTGTVPNYLWSLNPVFGTLLVEPYPPIRAKHSESRFTPSLTGQWNIGQNVLLYATYVTGFKAGGFDARSNGHPDPSVVNALNLQVAPPQDIVGVFEFEDEHAKSIEAGTKISLPGGRIELNAAIFNTKYEDLQTSVFDGSNGFNVANASEATTQGLELDSRWAVTESWSLSGSLGYLDFNFDDFRTAACYFNDPRPVTGPGTCDATGSRKEYTPEWSAALAADYERAVATHLMFRATAELQYSDDYIWSPTLDPLATQNAFTKVNLRLALGDTDGTWELALLGRNLTDETVSYHGGNATLAAALTAGTGNAYYTFVDRPRSIALQATVRFGD